MFLSTGGFILPTFVAIKIHYDHRQELPSYLKYSLVPSRQEYDDYLALFHEEGVGGNGFNECINFAVGQSDIVKFYLPPGYFPRQNNDENEFVFFSFTYGGDPELPNHIVGVHAGANLVSREGLERRHPFLIEGINRLSYHAEAPSDLVTLIIPPLTYQVDAGRYTPIYERNRWRNGLRYITEEHANNILHDAFQQASAALIASGNSERVAIERQLDVLRRIDARYGLGAIATDGLARQVGNGRALSNTEIGYLGERFVYEQELAYVNSIGRHSHEVRWTSQVAPTSPFDIQTLRRMSDGTVREHFLEVKSSAMAEGENVYISSMQVQFFEENRHRTAFALVNFGAEEHPTVRELTLDELYAEFDLQPVKYKLSRRT